jgi:hypothetical protein
MAPRPTKRAAREFDDNEPELSISDGGADDEGAEEEEEEEGEEEETAEERAEREAAHRAERGDDLDEEEEAEEGEGEESDADALRRVAGEDDEMVTRKRLNKVIDERNRFAEALAKVPDALAAAARGPAAPVKEEPKLPEFDLKAKVREKNKKLLEGDEDAAAEIELEIETHRQALADARAQQNADKQLDAKLESREMESILVDAFEQFPFLSDTNKKIFNEDALDEVCAMRDIYIVKGFTKPQALEKAILKVCPRYAKELAGDEEDEEDEGAPPKKKPSKEEKLGKLRHQHAAIAKRLPPTLGKHGAGNRAAGRAMAERDPDDYTDAEWERLPEEVKKRMRGDNLRADA